ncbi:hypothetical protein Pelo_16075 [Pelomyxa schiedti]|nr:hypothetical protein Pelo_16075 [Pelomyxa schiedti]
METALSSCAGRVTRRRAQAVHTGSRSRSTSFRNNHTMAVALSAVVTVLAFRCLVGVDGMVRSKSFDDVETNPFFLENTYGLMVGAMVTVDVSGKYEEGGLAQLSVLLCTHSETDVVLEQVSNALNYEEASQLCQTCHCNISSMSRNGKVDIDVIVYHFDVYNLLVLNCEPSDEYYMNASWTLLNPGAEQLPCGYMPNPDMYVILSMVWFFAASLWSFSLALGFRKATTLHLIVLLYGLVKLIWASFNILYWRAISKDGVIPQASEMVYLGLLTLCQSSFFLMIILLGTGWCVVTGTIRRDLPWVIGLTGGVIICIFSQSFISQNIIAMVVKFAFVVFRVFIIMYAFITVNQHIRDLNERLPEARNAAPGTQIYIDQERKRIFLSLKVFIVIWLILSLLTYFALIFFVHDWHWVEQLLSESLDFIMFILISVTYRVRDVPIFWGCPVVDTDQILEDTTRSPDVFQNEGLARRVQALLSRAPNEAHLL